MDPTTLGAALALVRSMSDTSVRHAIDAADRAEKAAKSVEQSSETIEEFQNTGLTVIDGKICVKVERS